MSVDVDIYMNNIIKFFRENPNDLLNLVPKNKEQDLYSKIKEVAISNFNKGEEVGLTQSQLINVCFEVNYSTEKIIEDTLGEITQKTIFGNIFLN